MTKINCLSVIVISALALLQSIATAQLIQPDSATAGSEFSGLYDIGNAIDGSGLPVKFGPSSAHADYVANNHWTTASGALGAGNANASFRFDQEVTLNKFHLWNHRSNNIAADANYGVTLFDLILKNGGGATLLSLLNQSATQHVAAAQTYGFNPVSNVRQVDFIIRTNGGSIYTGVAEVAFNATVIPFPAAVWLALPLLGGLGLSRFVKRRRAA